MCPRKDPAKKAAVWAANCPGKSPILTSKRPQIFSFDGKMFLTRTAFTIKMFVSSLHLLKSISWIY